MQSFGFLTPLKFMAFGFYGESKRYDCRTSDPAANSSLWKAVPPSTTFTELHPRANKIVKNGGVITLLKLDINDGGNYQCRAVNQAGKWIKQPQSPGGSMLLLRRGKVIDPFQ